MIRVWAKGGQTGDILVFSRISLVVHHYEKRVAWLDCNEYLILAILGIQHRLAGGPAHLNARMIRVCKKGIPAGKVVDGLSEFDSPS
jgi:hypothetical protein